MDGRYGYTMRPRPLAERFDEKIERHESGCWLWTGFVDKAGYARIREAGRSSPVLYAHRYSYERFVGQIPDGLHIDHLCRVKRCVNPGHLEPVTREENLRRGKRPYQVRAISIRCGRGHPRGEHTLFRRSTGQVVYCKACRRDDREAAARARSSTPL